MTYTGRHIQVGVAWAIVLLAGFAGGGLFRSVPAAGTAAGPAQAQPAASVGARAPALVVQDGSGPGAFLPAAAPVLPAVQTTTPSPDVPPFGGASVALRRTHGAAYADGPARAGGSRHLASGKQPLYCVLNVYRI